MKGVIKQKFPHPKNFHSLHHDTKCDPVDYRTEMIWERCNCHNFGEYRDIYFWWIVMDWKKHTICFHLELLGKAWWNKKKYLDTNNLYGTSMAKKLPIKDCTFLKEFPIIDVADDSEVGFIFECDLSDPWEYHDLHNSLAMAAENIHSLHHMAQESIHIIIPFHLPHVSQPLKPLPLYRSF